MTCCAAPLILGTAVAGAGFAGWAAGSPCSIRLRRPLPPRVKALEEAAADSKTKVQAANHQTIDLVKLKTAESGAIAALRGHPPGRPGASQCTGGHVLIGNQCECPPGAVGNGHGVCIPVQQAAIAKAQQEAAAKAKALQEQATAQQAQQLQAARKPCPGGLVRNAQAVCVGPPG